MPRLRDTPSDIHPVDPTPGSARPNPTGTWTMTPPIRGGCWSPSPDEYGPVAVADVRLSSGRDPTEERSDTPGSTAGRDLPDPSSHGHGRDGDRPAIGPYRLIRRVGRGGQGEVWEALRLEPPAGIVALKVLPPTGRRHPRQFARFRREAERGAALAGRGLLPVYEFGDDGRVAYFAMPLIDGIALDWVLDQRRRHRAGRPPPRCHRLAVLPEPSYPDAVARVLAHVARALAAAHAARVVHCDVKPANILLERGVAGRAYLIDFGLGRDLEALPASGPGTLDGTPLYMAPEKLAGRRADEASCDVYALGATGFEALALRPPRALPAGLPRREWASYLAGAEPLRPCTIAPRLPRELEAILARALARDPRRRYRSALAMAADLERYLAGDASR